MWTMVVMCLQKRIMPVPAEIHSGFCIIRLYFLDSIWSVSPSISWITDSPLWPAAWTTLFLLWIAADKHPSTEGGTMTNINIDNEPT